MKYFVWGTIVLLVVVHQDIWFWDDSTLIFGFMPIGLLWHVGISIAAGITWFMATRYCWPSLVKDDPSATEGGSS